MELLVTITIIAVVATLIAPTLNDDSTLRLMAASAILTSDIELAQVMTVSRPDKAVVVRLDPDQNRYWLAYASTPDTPIVPPGVTTFGQGRALTAVGVGLSATGVSDNTIEFNAQGGLTDFSVDPVIRLSLNERFFDLTLSATTGSVSETAGAV